MCKTTPQIAGISVSAETSQAPFAVDTQLPLRCGIGETLFGESVVTCMQDGTWSSPRTVCMPNQCGPVPDILNSVHRCTGTAVGDACTYSCVTTSHGSSSTLYCGTDGQWIGQYPECREVSCGVPPRPRRSYLSCANGFRSGSSCQASCSRGYVFVTADAKHTANPTMNCVVDDGGSGVWAGQAVGGACELRVCNATSKPDDMAEVFEQSMGLLKASCGQVSVNKDEIVECVFECALGYNLQGAASTACQESGDWTAPNPVCQPIRCPKFLLPPNGVLVASAHPTKSFIYGTEIHVRCDEGFAIEILDDSQDIFEEKGSSSVTRRCGDDGSWSGPDIRCVPLECSMEYLTLLNGNVKLPSRSLAVNSTAVFTCDKGYKLAGNTQVVCTMDASISKLPLWQPAVPECQPITCPGVDLVSHASVVCSNGGVNCNASFGSVCHFTCAQGYRFSTSLSYASRECTADGNWDSGVSACEPIPCDLPAPITHARFECAHEAVTGQSCDLVCDEGYHIANGTVKVNSTSHICSLTSSWVPSMSACAPVECSDLEAPLHGEVVVTGRVFQSAAVYTCAEGYHIVSGSNVRTCGSNGKWTDSTPVCEKVKCEGIDERFPTAHPHLIAQCSDSNHTYGTECKMLCSPGFELVLLSPEYGRLVTCTARAKWSHLFPTCSRMSCGTPILSRQSTLVMQCSGSHVNDTCSFQCTEGTHLVKGKQAITCLSTGLWSLSPPTCARAPELRDLARDQPTAQSSTKFEGSASLAVQSHSNTSSFVSCTHTYAENDPWWRVDLGEPKRISHVLIQNTQECSMSSIENIEVRVGNSLMFDGNSNPMCAYGLTITTDVISNVSCSEMLGRYVNIRAKSRAQALSLCHVRVIGYSEDKADLSVEGTVDLAWMRPAYMSSLTQTTTSAASSSLLADEQQASAATTATASVISAAASRAVVGHCTATDSQRNPWWTVDLLDVREVTHVIISAPPSGIIMQSAFEVRVGASFIGNGIENPVCSFQNPLQAGETRVVKCTDGGMFGRYITLHARGWDKAIAVCDVRVMGSTKLISSLVDLAIAKQWYMSSEVAPPAQLATATDANASCVFSTPSESPWWKMDLQVAAEIDYILIEVGPVTMPLLGIEVSNATHSVNCGVSKTISSRSASLFKCGGVIGRQISVTAFGWNQILSLCQVEIWGRVWNNGNNQQ
eukprot:c8784_g2_i1.p1 GENE.c8784_g2_i1~~c8784_g2_i1.p1  ORF type:complete len:1186 (+),score=334.55 c8784_g2_i1:2889-6446(+)